MIANSLNNVPIDGLIELLVKDNKIVPAPYKEVMKFTQEQISLFCLRAAIYQVPTLELIQFLQDEIGNTSAIEIGSGNGCFGRALGIKMVDNKMQNWPMIRALYFTNMQPTVVYGDDVEELDAIEGVKKYKPSTVVATWVTHKYDESTRSGNAFGVTEEQLFELGVKKYIHVGNLHTHAMKPLIRTMRPRVIKADWLVSRSMAYQDNVIFIFEKL
jgi:hypothetical protein